MYNHRKLSLLIFLLLPVFTLAQVKPATSFRIVPLGVLGGADESNLSAYMLAAKGTNNYICLDAGTIHAGIAKAQAYKTFTVPAADVLRKYIKGYFISHAHLDHLAGMVMNAPDDSTKNIYGLKSTLETIKTHYFTWESWANFADDGGAPLLKKYHYKPLEPGIETAIENTDLQVQVFPLAHSNLTSTAFLVRSKDNYLLYLGDTGADEIEKSQNLHNLWVSVAPLVKAQKLKAIMIEVSFSSEQPDKSLFGHLTPRLLMNEMGELSKLSNTSLKGFNVVVTHLKPPYKNITQIKAELKAGNKMQLNLIYPQQGKALEF
ncbi:MULTISPECIES: 3',5'-cyclic-nucleotide phosphodiesterase [unclassified Mucilaginibacter]|uniref:3',5'-cyclic-nucleotide phosphodiesterase n=1 Tax=unclassified Mucilaginibacter TaxID=2617802 RepID=UPI002AC9E993|nr:MULTISPECIES: 3',5'-cyclic-nucleotide phosphodiesterase [unclassified Mucilaginibacter]MEB0260604.1 3',5'-cyclic-nucleotide phosphodiesterase [Mucilaginibacter sp. 10I4]MEB0278040.1 3',5'-cyclic-nucleotide phosphodiesterase [Mucilaginibacter sp. 10B2]MEB0299606.1 3',5'-cyclic-nucleotide phosphodiesterase [Mucilaginibacter sp. 5C4]WPX22929.1 3',5'-cyclic-nucleotide phosphodiesterase [Mucilaginibacter sp. 5C4]